MSDDRDFRKNHDGEGDSLQDAIARFHLATDQGLEAGARNLALRRLLGRFVDVCNAQAYALAEGIPHRDLKPADVLLGPYDDTLLVEGRHSPNSVVYQSPEQAVSGLEEFDPASAVYNLGAILYYLVTGQPPFAGTDRDTILQQVQRGDFPPPRQIQCRVPAALEAICLKAMRLYPKDRYETPEALAEEIERWLAGEPVAAYAETLPARLSRWSRHHGPLLAATTVLSLTAVVGLIVGLLAVRSELRGIRDGETGKTPKAIKGGGR